MRGLVLRDGHGKYLSVYTSELRGYKVRHIVTNDSSLQNFTPLAITPHSDHCAS